MPLTFNPGQTVATGTIDDTDGPGSDKPIIGITVTPPTVQESATTDLTYTVAITNGKTSEFDTTVSFTLERHRHRGHRLCDGDEDR